MSHEVWEWTTKGTDRLQSEDDGDLLLGADGDQVVGQQLAGRQELVVTALIDEDVERRTGVRRRQRGRVVRLEESERLRTGSGSTRVVWNPFTLSQTESETFQLFAPKTAAQQIPLRKIKLYFIKLVVFVQVLEKSVAEIYEHNGKQHLVCSEHRYRLKDKLKKCEKISIYNIYICIYIY